jgi:hypothetical protein
MNNNKFLAFMAISLLIAALIFSSYPKIDVFGRSNTKGPVDCRPYNSGKKTQCCQETTNSAGELIHERCTDCDNTNPPSNCGKPYGFRPTTGGTFATGENTTAGVQGSIHNPSPTLGNANIPPRGGEVIEPGPKTSKGNDANVPPANGGELIKNDNNNNDNSHSP